MKTAIFLNGLLLCSIACSAQKSIRDESMTYQQERIVFKQWDRSKFTPTPGWLGINPYYLLTWGLHPNYSKTDLRPLGISGPQTMRLSLAGAMQSLARSSELHSDFLATVARNEIYAHSGLLSDTDPLWILYYAHQFTPVSSFDPTSLFNALPESVRMTFLSDGTLGWYADQIKELSERLNLTRSSDQDRGTRILSYHRILLDFRKIQGLWASKVAGASRSLGLGNIKDKLKAKQIGVDKWNSRSDVELAREVLRNRKY